MPIKIGSLMVIQMGNENLIRVNTLIIQSLGNVKSNDSQQRNVLKYQRAVFNRRIHVFARTCSDVWRSVQVEAMSKSRCKVPARCSVLPSVTATETILAA